MACEFEINFNLHQYRQSGVAAAAGFQLIDAIEDQMTVYRDHSEVSQLNRSAGEHPIRVEANLFSVLQLAQETYELTGGAFDISSGPLTKLWRFDRRAGEIPHQSEIDAVLEHVGMQWVELNSTTNSVSFRKPELEINLGGIGKGHALDRVGQKFLQMGIADFIIHGGQSSVLAFGSSFVATNLELPESAKAGENNRTTMIDQDSISEVTSAGWTVGLSHPTLPAVRLAEFTLRNQALGTSGTGRQGFFHHGKRYGHIIDPRSGWPPTHTLSSTVIAESTARADALATAFFVMSIEQISDFCSAHPEIGAVIVRPRLPEYRDKSKVKTVAGNIEIAVFNLDDSQFSILV